MSSKAGSVLAGHAHQQRRLRASRTLACAQSWKICIQPARVYWNSQPFLFGVLISYQDDGKDAR